MSRPSFLLIATFSFASLSVHASLVEELKPKREQTYAFTQKPSVTRNGDRVTIAFESKAFCDVTVVVEDAEGKIVRHLASGVLGPNAPSPFKKNSKKQTLVWNGKDDFGTYLDNKERYAVRVSLGLKPRFEKTLFWHPKKRNGVGRNPLFVPQPEGVYVYEGDGVEQIRLFDHDGKYVRTVYPFPAAKLRDVKGLGWQTLPDGVKVPEKIGYWSSTFLTGGLARTDTSPGDSAHGFAVHRGRIAVIAEKLSRLGTDGSSGGFALYGPDMTKMPHKRKVKEGFQPKSAAFSPDGKYLYLTGYYQNTEHRIHGCYGPSYAFNHGVYRMAFEDDKPPALWQGDVAAGKDDKHFDLPTSVAVDKKGRVYVADSRNGRVQIFSEKGELLKSVPAKAATVVQLHHNTGEIYVFCWPSNFHADAKARLAVFGAFDDPALQYEVPLPLNLRSRGWRSDESAYRAAVDSWVDPPRIWLVPSDFFGRGASLKRASIHIYALKDRKLVLRERFADQVEKSGIRLRSATMARQRLYVDPRSGDLYVAEGQCGVGKAFTTVVRIRPDTGKCKEIELPISPEEMAIDAQGHAYLRTTEAVVRYDIRSWREVPFDYGEERKTQFASGCKGGWQIALLHLPSQKPVYWHQQGMDVNFQGDLAVFCVNRKFKWRPRDGRRDVAVEARPYVPRQYPGRHNYGELHVYDKHGKPKIQDAIGGIPDGHGTFIDQHGDLYILVRGPRVWGKNKQVYAPLTGTIIKFKPGKGRFLSSSSAKIPLDQANRPKRPPDLRMGYLGDVWVEGHEWMYSGIGYARAGPCQCWNCRFVVDYLGRSFAPENLRSQVAVLDTNGNLITRIGRYGNVEDGKATDPGTREPPLARSTGGDEVAMMYANYVGTHTDRRLFIADTGNLRILSVKLGYHEEAKVALREVPNAAGR